MSRKFLGKETFYLLGEGVGSGQRFWVVTTYFWFLWICVWTKTRVNHI